MLDFLVVVEENVEVDVTRPFINSFLAAKVLFYALKLVKQGERLKIGVDLARAVDKLVLVGNVHWIRLPKATRLGDSDPSAIHLGASFFDHGNAVANIAPQSNVRLSLSIYRGRWVAGSATTAACKRAHRGYPALGARERRRGMAPQGQGSSLGGG